MMKGMVKSKKNWSIRIQASKFWMKVQRLSREGVGK